LVRGKRTSGTGETAEPVKRQRIGTSGEGTSGQSRKQGGNGHGDLLGGKRNDESPHQRRKQQC